MARRQGNIITADGVREISNALKALPGKGMAVVQTRAINKTLAGAKTETDRLVRSELYLKQRDVRPKIKNTRANYSRPYGLITVGAHPVPLARYPLRPVTPPSQKGVPVSQRTPATVHVLKRGSRKRVKGGFLARMKSGHVGIFMRDGGKREMSTGKYAGQKKQPIRELYGPGPGVHFRRNIMQRRLGRRIMPRMHKDLNHELNYYIRQQFRRYAKKGLKL